MNKPLADLERTLRISFRDRSLLQQAFTHSSYVNEKKSGTADNERLEFLGDAVLELTVSEYLFERHRDWSEGEMTRLRASMVCEPSLFRYAEALDFGSYVMLGKGEEQTGGRHRPALLADVFEAFVGALYLDQGLDAVRRFLRENVFEEWADAGRPPFTDYKSTLQERAQRDGAVTLEYRITETRGPAHDREFVAEVRLNGELLGTGSGRSKKEAEQRAAADALVAKFPDAGAEMG